MCLAIPGQILEVCDDHLATVDVSGIRRKVNVGLLIDEGLSAGDWVLIHVGFAMARVDEAEARATLDFLESMGQAFLDEVDALETSSVE